ncbi:MAG: hypothetical protein ABSD50_16085 [Smithella sp.]|jgi:hypothetical protein
METNTLKGSISDKMQNWIIILFIILISFIGLSLALICIYALPDKSVKPLEGSIFFACTSVIIIGLLFYLLKREKINIIQNVKEVEFNTIPIVIRESISDKIIKWLVTILSVFFVFMSFTIASICIYTLPDKTVQPLAGMVYFFSGAVVLGIFIFVVWKNWASKKP